MTCHSDCPPLSSSPYSWPQFCDPSYNFHEDDLGDIIQELKEEW